MAHIYGISGAEKNLLRECSPRIKIFEDIKPVLAEQQSEYKVREENFYDELPGRIEQTKALLEKLIHHRNHVDNYWNHEINTIRKEFEQNKLKIWKYLDAWYKQNFSKPKALKNEDEQIEKQKELIHFLEYNEGNVFREENEGLIDEIRQLKSAVRSPNYSGAIGERKVLSQLSKLDDSFHVFCDLDIRLGKYVSYHGRRNLRSAQMDFVVVGPTGIFLIEVKNWSDGYQKYHRGLNPYEQADRAGLVLWIYLKNQFFLYTPKVQKLLVSLKGNFQYDRGYKQVFCVKSYNICHFIRNHNAVLKENKIKKIVLALSS